VTDSHIQFSEGALTLLDQRELPHKTVWVRCTNATEVAEAIRNMVVRGAPAIGITAAYGMALALRNGEDMTAASEHLLASRPTAVNLRWAVERLMGMTADQAMDTARQIHTDDVAICRSLGHHGARLLPSNAQVFTHCNAGALATGGWGTALGVVRSAREAAGISMVFAGETRPWLQGARLTAWELARDNIPCTLVTDNAAASVLATGEIDAVVVGADRVAANGDVANKIGTLGLAVLAKHYGVPFYVAVPTSTIDLRCPNGADIPIEQRSADEVRGFGETRWAAAVPVRNAAFDVTPAELVTAWITEDGLWRPDGA
jgi:methylthioribose-1-phosphate isomerase